MLNHDPLDAMAEKRWQQRHRQLHPLPRPALTTKLKAIVALGLLAALALIVIAFAPR